MVKYIKYLLLCLIVIIFIISILVGFYLQPEKSNNQYVIVEGTFEIIVNNINANLLLTSGLMSFGIGTIIYLFINGGVLGTSINLALSREMDMSEIILSILPHAILEIPAMIISALIGLQIIEFIIIYFFSEYTFKNIILKFLKALIYRTIIVVILTILAGIIEWYITFNLL